jgi:hypothetical protein
MRAGVLVTEAARLAFAGPSASFLVVGSLHARLFRMRRHGLVILAALALASIVAAGAVVDTTIQRYDGAQKELRQVKASLAENTHQLRLARANVHAAQLRITARLYSLYVSGKPTTLDVMAGAHNLSQVIDSAEAAQYTTLGR